MIKLNELIKLIKSTKLPKLRKLRNWRLKHRILLIASVPVWLISMLMLVLVVKVGTTQIDGALKSRGAVIARQLAPASEYGAFSGNRDVLKALTQAVMKEDDAKAVLITDINGDVLAVSGSPSQLTIHHSAAADLGQALPGDNDSLIFGAPIYQGKAQSDDLDLFDRGSVKTDAPQKMLGYVYVELSTDASKTTKLFFMLISISIGLLGMAVATLLALRMSRQITYPLWHLLDGVNEMARGNLDVRIKIKTGGEIAELQQGFNVMAEQIKKGHEKMQTINSDLEHQVTLRTQELIEKNIDLERLSMTDRLTGLYNRLKLDQILDEEYARSLRYDSSFCIAMIDIDQFKLVNDTFGHQVGDQVLVAFASVLSENIRAIDVVGRWGGEEFLLICRATDMAGTIATAEKLRAAIAEHAFRTIGNRTASFGIAAYQPGDIIIDMIARADTALYRAKKNGRNRLEYEIF